MPEKSSPESERHSLATHLKANRQGIITEWTDVPREDPQIPVAGHLTLAALEDHFPELLGELIETVGRSAVTNRQAVRETAQSHGRTRWRYGYRLDEILRELALVRAIILRRVCAFCDEHHFLNLRTEAEGRIRRFFELVVANSARQFMQEQEVEVHLRSRQLQHACMQVQAATKEFRAVAESRLRLLRGVSHELRNALQAVVLGAEELWQMATEERASTSFSDLNASARRLQRVLDRLQQFSTILAGEAHVHLEPFDPEKFFDNLDKTFRQTAAHKGLALRFSRTTDLPVIATDTEKIRHIADILLSNALQYTERGGAQLSVLSEEPQRWIMRVADTGRGIDEISARHVFHEFHRSSLVAQEGVGLGLVIAYHLVHLMNGEITFQSSAGQGSRFEVNLPTCSP